VAQAIVREIRARVRVRLTLTLTLILTLTLALALTLTLALTWRRPSCARYGASRRSPPTCAHCDSRRYVVSSK